MQYAPFFLRKQSFFWQLCQKPNIKMLFHISILYIFHFYTYYLWRLLMNTERERLILEIFFNETKVSVKDLAKRLYTSESSIRRDLNKLEKEKLIRRVHGGAVLEANPSSHTKIPFLIRELEQHNEKINNAKKAASLIKDNSVIFLDASSSAYNIIPFLEEKKGLTIITNGLQALMKLAEYNNISAISTGGKLINSSYALSGEEAYSTLDHFFADICFFSCRGLSDDGELTDISEAEDYLRQKMIQHSQESFLLCNSNKMSQRYFHHLCDASQISGIISDCSTPPRADQGLFSYLTKRDCIFPAVSFLTFIFYSAVIVPSFFTAFSARQAFPQLHDYSNMDKEQL